MKHYISVILAGIGCLLTQPALHAITFDLSQEDNSDFIQKIKATTDKTVTLTGHADVTDLAALKYLPATVKTLDMSGLTVDAYTYTDGDYQGRKVFAAGELPPYMLFDTAVESVLLPANTTVIGNGCFASSGLKSISLPATVTSIGKYAFYECQELIAIEISSNTVSVAEGAFGKCASLLDFPAARIAGVEIPVSCFEGCLSMHDFNFKSIKTIGNKAFYNSGLETAMLQEVLSIGDYAFADCSNLESVTFNPNSTAGKGAFFSDTALTQVINHPENTPALFLGNSGVNSLNAYIPGPVVEAGSYAGTNISSAILSNTVTEIKAHAFRNAESLKDVNVTLLGDKIPTADPAAFDNPADKVLYVLPETIDLWEKAPVWNEFQIAGHTTIVEDMVSSDSNITAERAGNTISINSNRPITRVDVFSLDGKHLISATPMAFDCKLTGVDLPEIVMLRVADDRNVKALKLR